MLMRTHRDITTPNTYFWCFKVNYSSHIFLICDIYGYSREVLKEEQETAQVS